MFVVLTLLKALAILLLVPVCALLIAGLLGVVCWALQKVFNVPYNPNPLHEDGTCACGNCNVYGDRY